MDYAKTSHEVVHVGQNEWGSYWPLVQIFMQFEQRIVLELYACVGGNWRGMWSVPRIERV